LAETSTGFGGRTSELEPTELELFNSDETTAAECKSINLPVWSDIGSERSDRTSVGTRGFFRKLLSR
jgi:hypothetical protein